MALDSGADFSNQFPGYLVGADNHNIANNGMSWFDPNTYVDAAEKGVKFAAVSVLSGANSLFNSAVTVGNWLGANESLNDTGNWITSLDSDLGQYYGQNKESADLAGFVASSFLPGLGGVKFLQVGQVALRAGKAGMIGKNMATYTGLLPNSVDAYVTLAKADVLKSQAQFAAINLNTAKAVGAGLWQNTLEAAAFETFATAANFKSPVLEGKDNYDIAKDILTGALVGGVIGGVLEGAKTIYTVSKARVAEDIATRAASSKALTQEGLAPSSKIMANVDNHWSTPTADDFILSPSVGTTEEQTLEAARLAKVQAAIDSKYMRMNNENREQIHALGKNISKDALNTVADTSTSPNVNLAMTREQAQSRFFGLEEITHANVSTKAELEGVKAGQPMTSRWLNAATGEMTDEVPAVLDLASRSITKIGAEESTADAVARIVKAEKFKVSELWNPLEVGNFRSLWQKAELRHIWAQGATLGDRELVHMYDIPLLERAYNTGRIDIRVTTPLGQPRSFASLTELRDYVKFAKDNLAAELLARRVGKAVDDEALKQTTNDAIAKVVNVRRSYLDGQRSAYNLEKDLFGWQTATDEYHTLQTQRGFATEGSTPTPIYEIPLVSKLNYRVPEYLGKIGEMGADGHTVDAMTYVTAQQKLLRERQKLVALKQMSSKLVARLPDIKSDLQTANSKGAGGSMLSAAQAGYGEHGRLAASTQNIGAVTKDAIKAKRAGVEAELQDNLARLKNNQEASIEFSVFNRTMASTEEQYVKDVDNLLGTGEDSWVPKKFYDAAEVDEEGIHYLDDDIKSAIAAKLQPRAPQYVRVKNWEAANVIDSHTTLMDLRNAEHSERMAAVGKLNQRAEGVYRPLNPNPKDFQHFAFVKDERANTAGHTTMLFAHGPAELDALIAKTKRDFPEYTVLTKHDTVEYKAARQEYEYDRAINENYIDSSLKRKGIFANFYTETDGAKIADDILNYHYRSADTSAREAIRLHYNAEFNWLQDQAGTYSRLEDSAFKGGKFETIQANSKNPYISYIKTALDISSSADNGLWYSMNKKLDDAFSRVVGQSKQAFATTKDPSELIKVNEILQKYGANTSFADSAEMALVNHTAPKAELSKFIRAANSVMSVFTLGLDPLNAIVNAVGSTVLRGTELAQLRTAALSGNAEIAGAFAKLHTVIPGTDQVIASPMKMMFNADKALWQEFRKPEAERILLAKFKAQGFDRTIGDRFASMANDFTLEGTEGVKDLDSRLSAGYAKAKELVALGQKWSGNDFAEFRNRFNSWHVMSEQMAAPLIAGGHMSIPESIVATNTFMNRVEGNLIASQRPGLFQGPMGQAIGLFQSYQFNMMQQLFRYVGEGTNKDLAMLLGLQGTFFGLQGEPGFKLINDHIIGTMSSNPQHRDLYDATRGVAGKTGAEWLLYGTASNITQTNLYSRGDINPRQLTVIPTSLSEVPFVGGMSKVFSSLFEAGSKLANGGAVVESIRQGIEHNGISRPLAGLAQVSRALDNKGTVFSTSSQGSIQGSNDLMALASLSRLAGGRPLDEAIQNDTMFSIHAYEAGDRAKKQQLAETVKSTVIGLDAHPDENSVNHFAAKYAELGGKQMGFNKYMMEQYTQANTPQAQLLAQKLKNPLSYKIQSTMLGYSE